MQWNGEISHPVGILATKVEDLSSQKVQYIYMSSTIDSATRTDGNKTNKKATWVWSQGELGRNLTYKSWDFPAELPNVRNLNSILSYHGNEIKGS